MTKILTIKNLKEDAALIEEAAGILKNGGLVAFPTETVYGLGANALSPDASKKIYAAKGRPSDNPLIVHIADESELAPLVTEIPPMAKKLMDAFWPGPMTLIFNKSDIVPSETTGGLNTVAVRMPSHKVAAALIKVAGIPIAAPSANVSGRPSPTAASHVIEDMDGRIDAIVDGGASDIGLESTIIDVTGGKPIVLRPGYIAPEDIERIVGETDIDAGVTKKPEGDFRPKAPGMKYRHYAPKAPMTIVEGDEAAVISRINELIKLAAAEGKRAGIICASEHAKGYGAGSAGGRSAGENGAAPIIKIAGSKSDEEEIAHNLFDILRSMDDEDIDVIYTEKFAYGKRGMAIMNRMMKAAGYNILKV